MTYGYAMLMCRYSASYGLHEVCTAIGTVCDCSITLEQSWAVQISTLAGECANVHGWLISLSSLYLPSISRNLARSPPDEIAGDRWEISKR